MAFVDTRFNRLGPYGFYVVKNETVFQDHSSTIKIIDGESLTKNGLLLCGPEGNHIFSPYSKDSPVQRAIIYLGGIVGVEATLYNQSSLELDVRSRWHSEITRELGLGLRRSGYVFAWGNTPQGSR